MNEKLPKPKTIKELRFTGTGSVGKEMVNGGARRIRGTWDPGSPVFIDVILLNL